MIGFFDSGFGGLSILKRVVEVLGKYDYMYLGDNKEAPYGDKCFDDLYNLTKKGVDYLFREGCEVVILACNTASSGALRKIQQEYLIDNFPQKRVLGVVFPTVEGALENLEESKIGVLATEATVKSKVYLKEFKKNNSEVKVYQQAAPSIVPLVESGDIFSEDGERVVRGYLDKLLSKDSEIKTVILGCTHYLLIKDIFEKVSCGRVRFFYQDDIVAVKLAEYLKKHKDIEKRLCRGSKVFFRTTGDEGVFNNMACKFYGKEVIAKSVNLK